MNWFKYKPCRSTLDEELHLIVLSSFIVSIYVLNTKSSDFVFLGACVIFQTFLFKKVCFSVLLLNSIEVKGSRFISGE